MTQTEEQLYCDMEKGLKAIEEYRFDEVRDTLSPEATQAIMKFIMMFPDEERATKH